MASKPTKKPITVGRDGGAKKPTKVKVPRVFAPSLTADSFPEGIFTPAKPLRKGDKVRLTNGEVQAVAAVHKGRGNGPSE